MRSFLGLTLVSVLALLGFPIQSFANAELDRSNSALEAFSLRLQTVLNSNGVLPFDNVVSSPLKTALTQRYKASATTFPSHLAGRASSFSDRWP